MSARGQGPDWHIPQYNRMNAPRTARGRAAGPTPLVEMVMSRQDPRFAFIIHPIDPRADVRRRYPWLAKVLPEGWIHYLSGLWPPLKLSDIEGIESQATGERIRGWLLACPLTPQRMRTSALDFVYRKIIQTVRLAERLGADIVGLGAWTAAIGDAGETVARAARIPVTTGDAYTVAVVVEQLRQAARLLGVTPWEAATVAVVGATGAIGRAAADLLADQVARVLLIGRRPRGLQQVAQALTARPRRATVEVTTDLQRLIEAPFILSATTAGRAVIQPEYLQPGSVVLDVALPRDVSLRVQRHRQDVLVLDGGIVRVPGPVNFHFNFGLPRGLAYACMAETMILTLERRFECYTIGRNIPVDKVNEIARMGARHGFEVAPLMTLGRRVRAAQWERVRHAAQQARSSKEAL